jgi:hypothetical protein
MKNIIFAVIAFCGLILGCNDWSPVDGHYYIKSDTPITITYSNIDGNLITDKTDLLDYHFRLTIDNCRGNFYYQISWSSDTFQRVDMVVEFDGEPQIDQVWTTVKTVSDKLYYCTPWGSDCETVHLGM